MKSKTYVWLNAVVGQFIEGACDSFLIVAGGSTVSQALASGSVPAQFASLKTLVFSVVLGGAIYAASYLKTNPTPDSLPDTTRLAASLQGAATSLLLRRSDAPAASVPSAPPPSASV